jgi:hypothetical protein
MQHKGVWEQGAEIFGHKRSELLDGEKYIIRASYFIYAL